MFSRLSFFSLNFILILSLLSCSNATSNPTNGNASPNPSNGTDNSTCTYTGNTTETSTKNTYGCALLTRDTTSCKADRENQGLSGFWLKFSCNVTLTKSGSNVKIETKSLPDYKSYYFSTSDACYEAFSSTERKANPNTIATQSLSITVPFAPTAAGTPTALSYGAIGVAVNGVSIFSNTAAPGDDIFKEEATFDKCDGHPEKTGKYHYHSEPGAISNSDAEFIGVLRDGFPVYGRNDYETSTTVTGLDAQGGKSSKTVDSPDVAVYHYHANLQTNGTSSVYFLTKDKYTGTPGTCTGCN